MDSVQKRKINIQLEINDLRLRIKSQKSVGLVVDIVLIRAYALKITDLQKELEVINIMITG